MNVVVVCTALFLTLIHAVKGWAVPMRMSEQISSSSHLNGASSTGSSSSSTASTAKLRQEPSGAASDSMQPHFGDIMEGTSTPVIDLSEFTPLERIALTANGNLQRIISSYYNAAVEVDILRCERTGHSTYDREVTLSVAGTLFCKAVSRVTLHSAICVEAVEQKSIGIGQLFRHLDILPRFRLLQAGRSDTNSDRASSDAPYAGGVWRSYELRCKDLSCDISEYFVPKLFNLPLDKQQQQPLRRKTDKQTP